ncbi:MAG: hypothetical protein QF632_04855 [Candidatus Woesearchaeota archaeon]|nr:hypothetical protein [Candidatus Woesearchaeota archaeon]
MRKLKQGGATMKKIISFVFILGVLSVLLVGCQPKVSKERGIPVQIPDEGNIPANTVEKLGDTAVDDVGVDLEGFDDIASDLDDASLADLEDELEDLDW